jgi:hypothetical protein
MPTEREWVHSIISKIEGALQLELPKTITIEVTDGTRLPYAYEVLSYKGQEPDKSSYMGYQTDILISQIDDDIWIPRIIIECKKVSVSTHDAIVYSTKASTHKNVHPYLRYGILLGKRTHYPIPGRLIRHGAHFDFMVSWKDYEPELHEWNEFIKILKKEVMASTKLEEALTSSRSPNREHYFILHRRLELK